MSDDDRDVLAQRLDALSRRIDARLHDLEKLGVFPDADNVIREELQKRHDAIRQKLDTAVRDGGIWNLLKTEIQLDVDSLIDEFTQWENNLDAKPQRTGLK